MPFEPEKITRELVLQAVDLIEKNQLPLEKSTHYDVYINDKPYPPKEVMRYAHELVNGEKLWNLKGGKATNDFLKNYGFKVKRKEYVSTSYYWVCQGKTYEYERQHSILAAKNDHFHHHQTLKDLKVGDRVIHYYGSAIVAISTVVAAYTFGMIPHEENEKGLIVKIEFDDLSYPIEIDKIRQLLQGHPEALPKVYSPLDRNLDVNQGYLFPFTKEGFELLVGPEDYEEETINHKTPFISMQPPSLNTILYGPPGTGKTYSTMEAALKILGVDMTKITRNEMKAEYDKMRSEGRIVFTSFHQSLSYEDFIEGIKPETKDNTITYWPKPGIFKIIANDARKNYELSLTSKGLSSDKVPFDLVFEKLTSEVEEGKLADHFLEIHLQTSKFQISDIINDSIKMVTSSGGNTVLTKPTIRRIYENPEQLKSIITGGRHVYYEALLEKLNSYAEVFANANVFVPLENFVLIIDEINRGSVSQIFGELITLLEEDKRLGNPEALEVKLPYSGNQFGVAPNLYIIGTMNTADRSVEALDTALRRRFEFKELQPQPHLLTPEYRFWSLLWEYRDKNWTDKKYKEKEEALLSALGASTGLWNTRKEIWERMKREGKSIGQTSYFSTGSFQALELSTLLEVINERIELLLNRDHLIGHSYFFHVYTEADLKKVMYKKIIPLLQEYFYGDYGKIGLVLGKGFVKIKNDGKFKPGTFAQFGYEDQDLLQRVVYEIIPEEEVNIKQALRDLLGR